jgi:hypothetical protein
LEWSLKHSDVPCPSADTQKGESQSPAKTNSRSAILRSVTEGYKQVFSCFLGASKSSVLLEPLTSEHKTALIRRMLRGDPLDGKSEQERSKAIHNTLMNYTAEVASNRLLLHAFVSEYLLHEVSSDAIQCDGLIVGNTTE